jgi:hypothetical protein
MRLGRGDATWSGGESRPDEALTLTSLIHVILLGVIPNREESLRRALKTLGPPPGREPAVRYLIVPAGTKENAGSP